MRSGREKEREQRKAKRVPIFYARTLINFLRGRGFFRGEAGLKKAVKKHCRAALENQKASSGERKGWRERERERERGRERRTQKKNLERKSTVALDVW